MDERNERLIRSVMEIKRYCSENRRCYGCPFNSERQCLLESKFPVEWPVEEIAEKEGIQL